MKICIGAEPKQILAAVILGAGDDEVKPVPRGSDVCKGTARGGSGRDEHSSGSLGIFTGHPRQTATVYIEVKNAATLEVEEKRRSASVDGILMIGMCLLGRQTSARGWE